MDRSSITSSSMRVRSRSIEIAFICQVIAIFIVIIACVVNLSIGLDKAELWSSLLSGTLGYLLPSPKIRRKNESFLYDTTRLITPITLSGDWEYGLYEFTFPATWHPKEKSNKMRVTFKRDPMGRKIEEYTVEFPINPEYYSSIESLVQHINIELDKIIDEYSS